VNFSGGETVANLTLVGLTGGDACFASSIATQLIVDSFGWSNGAGLLAVQSPVRVLDTRDAASWATGISASGNTIQLRIAGRAGVPNTADAALINVTVANPTGEGYVTVWPCDQPFPLASVLNTFPGAPRSNLASVKLSASGEACLRYVSSNATPTDLIVDAVGWTPGAVVRADPAPAPLPTPIPAPGSVPAGGSAGCGLVSAAFCETFDHPANGGTRTGDLDPVVWGVSRLGVAGYPAESVNQIFDTNLIGCGTTKPVASPADVRICNGQLIEAQNDGHAVDNLDIYPKQPFDFAGRTGTIAFDVSANSEGAHAAWPEIIITDKPVPAPRQDVSNDPNQNNVLPPAAANEIGIVFAGGCTATANTTGVSEIYVTRNNVFARVPMTQTNCVTSGSTTKMNHFEVRVSQNHIEVWGTDAGSTTLKQIAVADNIGLTFTRGLVWMTDTHYNACKFDTQCDHTFAWDNFGFDGPKTYRDLGFDVPDNTARPDAVSTNVGYLVGTGPMTFTVTGVHHDQTPTGAQIVFNYLNVDATVPTISLNGNPPITTPHPFAANDTGLWKTISVPVPLNQTQDGTNTITITSNDSRTILANISLILVAAAPVP
jgi:hypothetical protein